MSSVYYANHDPKGYGAYGLPLTHNCRGHVYTIFLRQIQLRESSYENLPLPKKVKLYMFFHIKTRYQ